MSRDKIPEMFTFRSETDAAQVTGTFSLTSDILQAAVSMITIPAGMVLKIWAFRVSGAAVVVNTQFAKTNAGPFATKSVVSFNPTLDSWIEVEKRKPIEIRGLAGGESTQFTWVQSVAAKSYVEFDISLEREA